MGDGRSEKVFRVCRAWYGWFSLSLAYAERVSEASSTAQTQVPPAWELALLSLRQASVPPRVSIHEVPAPVKIAPYAVAISAETALHVEAEAPATGRFVCLYDPQTQEGWGGEFRVIALVATDTELALGEDPLAGEVAWSWLRECLASRDADYGHLVGTATTTINRSFEGFALRATSATLEIRASWTPGSPDLSAHFLAWLDTMLQATGLSPEENITQLRH